MKSWCRSINKVASSQLIMDKTCRNDSGLSPDKCSDFQHHNANNPVVRVWVFIPRKVIRFYGRWSIKEFSQKEVVQFRVYERIADHLFAIIGLFFLGSWSDAFGCKQLLYFCFLIRWIIQDIQFSKCMLYKSIGRMVEGSAKLANAHFMSLPRYNSFVNDFVSSQSGYSLSKD